MNEPISGRMLTAMHQEREAREELDHSREQIAKAIERMNQARAGSRPRREPKTWMTVKLTDYDVLRDVAEKFLQSPTPSEASAMLTNPHTGEPRDYRDVGSDPTGMLIHKTGAPLHAAIAPPRGSFAGEVVEVGMDLQTRQPRVVIHGTMEQVKGAATWVCQGVRTFVAIESAALVRRPWREILGFQPSDTMTSAEVERRFKELAAGVITGDQLTVLTVARDAARNELCYETDQSNWGNG